MYILDTNVISELRKARKTPGAPHIAHFAMCGFLRDRTVSEITITILLIGSPTVAKRD